MKTELCREGKKIFLESVTRGPAIESDGKIWAKLVRVFEI